MDGASPGDVDRSRHSAVLTRVEAPSRVERRKGAAAPKVDPRPKASVGSKAGASPTVRARLKHAVDRKEGGLPRGIAVPEEAGPSSRAGSRRVGARGSNPAPGVRAANLLHRLAVSRAAEERLVADGRPGDRLQVRE